MSENIKEEIPMVEITNQKPISPKIFKKPPPPMERRQRSSESSQTTSKSEAKDIVSLFSVGASNASANKKATNAKVDKTYDEEVISTISQLEELSDDVFLEEEANRRKKSVTTTPSTSYKEKIKNRFNTLKKRAGSSNANIRSSRTINIDEIRKKSKHVDAEISEVRSKYKRQEDNIKSDSNFYLLDSKDTDKSKDEIMESNTESDFYLYNNFKSHSSDLKLSEKENFFNPFRVRSDRLDRIKIGEIPRNIEEEGIFVPGYDHISNYQKRLLENRLFFDDDSKWEWFNSNGDLIITNNPIINQSIRPEVKNDNTDLIAYNSSHHFNQECEEIVLVHENILEFSIINFQFTHHPLFSVEHILKSKLQTIYESYSSNLENNNLQRLINQLNALRGVKTVQLDQGDGNQSTYFKEITELRQQIFREGKKQRDQLKQILEYWKRIKKIREVNKFSATDVKIIIKIENIDFESDRKQYEKFFEKALNEVIGEERMKLSKKRKKIEPDKGMSDTSSLSESEHVAVNIEKIRTNLLKKFEESFRPPGEPIIQIILTNDNEISKENLPELEVLRRGSVSNIKIYFRLLCNKLEIWKSEPLELNDCFNVNVLQKFGILLPNKPKHLTFEIIEHNKNKSKTTYKMNLPLSISSNVISTESFQKDELIPIKIGVGSGNDIKSILNHFNLDTQISVDDLNEVLFTSGEIFFKANWEKKPNLQDYQNLTNEQLINEIIEKNGTINRQKLREWMTNTVPDPQDPKNLIFYEFAPINEIGQKNLNDIQKYFRLNPFISDFCNFEEIENNLRLQVLQLRDKNEIEFDGMLIPNRIKEVQVVISEYKSRFGGDVEDIDDDSGGLDQQRLKAQKYLKRVYTKIYQKCKSTKNNLNYEDVVDEKMLNYFQLMIKTMLKNFLNWFRWQPRVMQPLPVIQPKVSEMMPEQLISQVHVIVNLISGKNFPKRNFMMENKDEQDDETPEEINPFIEIVYNNITVRSSTSNGLNPIWNESLKIPLESQHTDYLNPNSLNGSITINVFDEVASSTNENGNSNWLGFIDIPISAMCSSNDVLQGFFKVQLPKVLFGYKLVANTTDNNQIKSDAPQNDVYVEMVVKVLPNVPKLTPSMWELECGEVPYIRDHIIKWNENYNNSFPNRKFSTFAIDLNGKTVCFVRYLKPLEPPQINSEEFDITADQCFRFVSLIPFTDSNHFYQNVWLTTEQLINLMIGSVIDHAVALTCFLLALKMDCWLLLGFGIPQGITGYVLVRQRQQNEFTYYIYDVFSKNKFHILDPYLPLKKVYCIANNENLWANTQRNDNISTMRWDLSRRNDWLPLFNENVRFSGNFVNNEVSYKPRMSNIENIEATLERKLKKKITKLRQLERTKWNHKLSNTMKNCLRLLEINTMHQKSTNDIVLEINKALSHYHVNGFILNMPYTTANRIVNRIKSLKMHLEHKIDTNEYALFTHVHSYVGNLLSVWVLIINLSNK